MKRSISHSTLFATSLLLFCTVLYSVCAQIQSAPPSLSATLTVKIAAFEKSLSSRGGELTIHVVNAPDIARELRKTIGYQVGKSKVGTITEGTTLPSVKPDIIFIGGGDNISKVIAYARHNGILSVCNTQDVANAGATLMLAINQSDNKPYASISAASSKEEGMEWNPAIFKIVRSVK